MISTANQFKRKVFGKYPCEIFKFVVDRPEMFESVSTKCFFSVK